MACVFLPQVALAESGGITCKVHSFLVDSNYKLPYRYDRLEIVNGSSYVKPEDYVVYAFEIQNKSEAKTVFLQKAYMTQLLGKDEPLEIIQVHPQNGNCNINGENKSVFCSINYSFGESAHYPIEYLVKVKKGQGDSVKTSSLFSIETSEGSAQCASYLSIKNENTQNPISWSTSYAAFKSGNFYIRIGDKKFYGKEPVRITSDPGADATTLESTWNENGVEMRMYMYFKKIANGEWEMYELRTYNGQQNGDWIYYKDSIGNRTNSIPGYHNYHDNRVFVPIDGKDAEIYCDKCSINAFLKNSVPISETGYSLEFLIGLPEGKVITITNEPLAGYGVNVLLKNSSGEVVEDQSDAVYEWKVDRPEIVFIEAENLDYGNGKCAYDISSPCPLNHVSISGLKSGKATISLIVKRKSSGVEMARNSFPVVVNEVNPTPVRTKCVNRGEVVGAGKEGECCSGLSLIRPEGDRIDVLGVCLRECSKDSDCFSGEICQKQTSGSKYVCSVGNRDNEVVNQLKDELKQLKTEVENQKVEQNKLTQMIVSIKQFLQKMFGSLGL